jgi:ATP-dependent helicase HrpA
VKIDPRSVTRRDAPRLARALGRNPTAATELAAAEALLQRREAARAAVSRSIRYPQELPITAHVEELRAALRVHRAVIVAGETGSGKTTQLPKLCLEAGFGARGGIVHTQPRRLAARAVAARVAEELAVALGAEVGYAVRFSDRTGEETLVKVVTDGLLLTEIRHDRDLLAYDVVIVDEAHERSLNIDFLLGYLKALLARRDDLLVIVTSATIDVERFSAYFEAAPVIEVSGRGHPVSVHYRDPVAEATDGVAADPIEQVVACIEEIDRIPPGPAPDVLVFLPGEREILEASRALRRRFSGRLDVLALYARLPASEQQRIFSRGTRRRVVLATNVAETSLTVPFIGYVVDTGLARVSRYSYRSKLQRLPVERISRASADQRMGRCGRVAPGVCYRLYAESDHLAQSAYTDPEILRTNLAAVVLQMRAFDLGDPATFPFLDPPDPRALKDATTLLTELGALVDDVLTPDGRTMARLPVDPRLARMLVEASRRGALREVLVIASGLSVNDPRERPLEARAAADAAQRDFRDERSDFASLLRLFAWYESERQSASASALRRACRSRFLSETRLREWRDLHRQLRLAARDLGWRENTLDASYEAVHTAILAGSASMIGFADERGEYQGARGIRFRIFPGSALAAARPRWLVAAEISETARLYARTVAAVEPRWIETVAAHLLKRTYSEPHWDPRRGEVVALERVTLYGLALVERRRVSFKRIDRALCREVFIRDGLLPGALARPPPFLEHNLELVASVREHETRVRRRDLLVEERALAAFYDERLPADVVDVRSLEHWRRRAEAVDPKRLYMERADVLARLDDVDVEAQFPSSISLGGVDFELHYSFAPGAIDDGVSVQVPLGLLHHVQGEALEWLVPGLLEAKCEALVRALPKSLRRQLAPLPEKLVRVVQRMTRPDVYRNGRITTALGDQLEVCFGVHVPADAWAVERIADPLRMNVQLRDPEGRLLDQDRDFRALARRHAERIGETLEDPRRATFERRGLESFPEEGVPRQLLLGEGRGQAVFYPTLADTGERVDLILTASPAEQAARERSGYVRLVLLADRGMARQMRGRIRENKRLTLHYAPLGGADALVEAILFAVTWASFFEGEGLPGSQAEFRRRLAARRERWQPTFVAVLEATQTILERRFRVVRALEEARSPAFAPAVADVRRQLETLVGADFLTRVPVARLVDLPRYLDAMCVRLEGLQGRVAKDAEAMGTIETCRRRIDAIVAADAPTDAVLDLTFALEELRVALFAQRLGTREKISAKRFDEMLAPVERALGLR